MYVHIHVTEMLESFICLSVDNKWVMDEGSDGATEDKNKENMAEMSVGDEL